VLTFIQFAQFYFTVTSFKEAIRFQKEDNVKKIKEKAPTAGTRKPGRRKMDLSDESSSRVLKVMKSLIRTDWGGKNPGDVIRKKAEEKGLEYGPMTVDHIIELVEDAVDGCRKRAFPRVDEVIARLEGAEGKPPPKEKSK
jgi:hypothetical protein